MKSIALPLLAFALFLGGVCSANAATETRSHIPDYDVTPLTQEDVDLYLSVMRETVDRLENPTGPLRDIFEARERIKVLRMEYGKFGSAERLRLPRTHPAFIAELEAWKLSKKFWNLSNYDALVASERHQRMEYAAIREAIDFQLGDFSPNTHARPACGRGGDCGANPTQLQVTLMQREKSARSADAGIIARSRAEIEDLRRRFKQDIPDSGY